MQGVLLIDKPKSWTSFDVVNYVRRIVAKAESKKPKNTKVGHTGTLDPQATGLLVLLIGKEYTRRAGEFSKLDKTYEVTMKLGETSTTGDSEGVITPYRHPELVSGSRNETGILKHVRHDEPSKIDIDGALDAFQGQIMQVPPAFSAMKVNGQRAYVLARKGQEVNLEARPVTIYENELTGYEYPFVKFTSKVSSGTYIRALVEDIGKRLGTGAYMSDLRRTEVDTFSIDDALEVEGLNQDKIIAHLQQV